MFDFSIAFEWIASLLGVSGALLISIRKPVAGYVICLIGCIGAGGILYFQGNYGLLFQQAAFFCINLVGIYSWQKKSPQQFIEGI